MAGAADLVFLRTGFLVGGLPCSRVVATLKKLVDCGVGLWAPSLTLMGSFLELALVGTGNGGAGSLA